MKLYLKSIWQKSFAAFVLPIFFGASIFAQTAKPKAIEMEASSLSSTERELTKNISLESIKSYTIELAADEMEGRGTMQPGGDRAAKWIAEKFRNLGLKPLGDNGSYLQSIKFKETVLTPETKFEVNGEKFKLGKDYAFIPLPFEKTDGYVIASTVFAGYGMQSSDARLNSDMASKIRGKIVILIDGPPANISKEQWDKSNRKTAILQSLIIGGAKAIVIVGNGRKDDKTETYIDYLGRRQISLASETAASSSFPVPPLIMISRALAAKLFTESEIGFKEAQMKAENKDFKVIKLNKQVRITAKYQINFGTSSNVVGYIEGVDSRLKAEAVLFSAHYDAYGVDNGQIFNGAADNALGTSKMLAVAEAYSKMNPKPKRSMIFLAVTGEEYGLYGSKHWADNPTWDLAKVVANLNLDGIGTVIYGPVKNMIGFGAEHSTLGIMLEDVAKSYGIKIIPDPQPEEKLFTRSDHYSFVQKGIPALMLMGLPEGTAKEIVKKIKDWAKVYYHQPADDVMENWHWEGAKTVADMTGILGLRISNLTKAPEWFPTSEYSKIDRNKQKGSPVKN